MTNRIRINARSTLNDVREALRVDGYDPELAEDVRRAFHAGALLWTRRRLTTTDGSRIDVRPARVDWEE